MVYEIHVSYVIKKVYYITWSRVVIKMNHFYYVIEWSSTSSITGTSGLRGKNNNR